jgi:hypothetical protein
MTMAQIKLPQVEYFPRPEGDGGGRRQVYFRLAQLQVAAVTVGATAWCATLGAVPAILALMVAKHVLVAILLMECPASDRGSPA